MPVNDRSVEFCRTHTTGQERTQCHLNFEKIQRQEANLKPAVQFDPRSANPFPSSMMLWLLFYLDQNIVQNSGSEFLQLSFHGLSYE